MRRPLFIARQSRRPAGVTGRVIASIMARETATLNDRALERMSLDPSDAVLEVGFGHGRTIERIASIVDRGRVCGVDVSVEMRRVASSRNRAAIQRGGVELRTADWAALPFGDREFDKALSVHTLYFLAEPWRCFREIARVLRRGGRFVLGFTRRDSPDASKFPAEIYTFYADDDVRSMLIAAGFRDVELVRSDDGAAIATGTT